MNRLTILIPTKNRPEFLRRALRYLDRIKIKADVFIADGSDDNVFALNAAAVDDVKQRLTITHWQPAKDINTTRAGNCRFFYIPRLALAIEKISTPYVHLLCDDSFVGSEFLARACLKLDSDPTIGAVVGQTWTFSLDATRDTTHYHGPIKDMQCATMDPPRPASSALYRLLRNPDFGALNNSLWATYRTALLRCYLQAGYAATRTLFTGIPSYMPGAEEEWTLDFVHGIMAAVFQMLWGDVAYIPHLMFGHQAHSDNLGLHLFRGPKFPEAVTRPYFGLIVGSYIASATKILVQLGESEDDARIAVTHSLWTHMARRLPGWITERRDRVMPHDPKNNRRRLLRSVPGLHPAAVRIFEWYEQSKAQRDQAKQLALMQSLDIMTLRNFLETGG